MPIDLPDLASLFLVVDGSVWRGHVRSRIRGVKPDLRIVCLTNGLNRAHVRILDTFQIVVHFENEGAGVPHLIYRILRAVEPILAPELLAYINLFKIGNRCQPGLRWLLLLEAAGRRHADGSQGDTFRDPRVVRRTP